MEVSMTHLFKKKMHKTKSEITQPKWQTSVFYNKDNVETFLIFSLFT